MYQEFETYFDARIAEVNATISGTANDLFKADTNMNPLRLASSNKDRNYLLAFEDYEDGGDVEAGEWGGTAVVTIKFPMTQSDTVKYKTVVDTYIHVLLKKIQARAYYSVSGFNLRINGVGCRNMNTFEDNHLNCEIVLKFKVNE